MSKVADLVQKLCPDGVDYRPLGEIGSVFGGLTGKSKADFSDGDARYVSYVSVFHNLAVDVEPDDFVRIGPNERQRQLQRGDVIFTGSSETPSEVAISSVVTTEVSEPLYLNSFCIGYRFHDPELLNPEFTKHLFRSSEMRKQLVRTANGVTRFNVSKARLAKVKIPVPPMEVQREIARVLDVLGGSGSSLAAELTAELAARRQQYAHYRDTLFNFDEVPQVPWRAMGDVGQFFRGRRFTKQDYVEDGGIPVIHYGQIYTHFGTAANSVLTNVRSDMASTLRFAAPGDVVIAAVGETVEDVAKAVAWLGDDDVAIHDDCFAFRGPLNPKFVSYYFQTARFHAEKNKFVARAKVKRISGSGLAKMLIPTPDRESQDEIVRILDQFAELVSNSSGGLGAEISARRIQYEYYRDRLLRFEEMNA